MSSYRFLSLIGVLLVLSSCGFQPLYGGAKNRTVNQELGHIHVATIEDRQGQILHNLLLDRLNATGRPGKPKYTLSVKMQLSKSEIGLKFTEEATRAKLTLSVQYYLTENRTGELMAEGAVRSVNSYNITDSEFARVASEEDATERASREVSDEIRTRLSVYFSQRNS